MIDRVTVLESEFLNHPWLIGWKRSFAVIVRKHWQDVEPDEFVVCGGDLCSEYVRRWLERGQPAAYIGRGYIGNHLYKTRRWWRVTVSGWANLTRGNPPFARWPKMELPRHPWRVHEVKRVLIAPSALTTPYWTGQSPHQLAEGLTDKFPGAEVKVRYKEKKSGVRWSTLWNDLDWADLVVSQSSAITCEALWWGKKAISLEPCPTWLAGDTSLDSWDDPTEPPHRDTWHEHLAWSQYTNEDWESGGALRMFDFYSGGIQNYRTNYQYQFHR